MSEAGPIARAVLAGEDAAIASAISRIENLRPETAAESERALLAQLAERTPASHTVVGVTGPPGAGKSSLCSALLDHWLAAGAKVGMLAVDPSSRRSGGALLGDRTRVRLAPGRRAFVRSMAARERLGGLASAAQPALAVLRAAFEWTLLETVGVGQSETDVAAAADSVVLVLQPGSGDSLQLMKAGILEIPDVFSVHKWDVGAAAQRTRDDLEAMLPIVGEERGGWRAPVVATSAHTGEGIAELAGILERHRQHLASSGERERRRRAGRDAWVIAQIEARFGSLGLERLGGRRAALESCASIPGTLLDALAVLSRKLEP